MSLVHRVSRAASYVPKWNPSTWAAGPSHSLEPFLSSSSYQRGKESFIGVHENQANSTSPVALKHQRQSVRQLLDSVQPLIPVLVSSSSKIRNAPKVISSFSAAPTYIAARGEMEPKSHSHGGPLPDLDVEEEQARQHSLPVPTTPHWTVNTAAKFLSISGYHLLYEDSTEEVVNYILGVAFSRVTPTNSSGLEVDQQEKEGSRAAPPKHRFGTTPDPPVVHQIPMPSHRMEGSVGDTLLSMEGITDLILGIRHWDMVLQLTSDREHLPASSSTRTSADESSDRTSVRRGLTVSQQFVGTLLFRLIASTRHSPSPADVLAHLQTLLTPNLSQTPFVLMDVQADYTDPTILQHLPDQGQLGSTGLTVPSVTQLSRYIALRRAWKSCFQRVAAGPAVLGLQLGHLLLNLLEVDEVRSNMVSCRTVQVMLKDWMDSMTKLPTPTAIEASTASGNSQTGAPPVSPFDDQEQALISDVVAHYCFLKRITTLTVRPSIMESRATRNADEGDPLGGTGCTALRNRFPFEPVYSISWLTAIHLTLQQVLLSMHSFSTLEMLTELWESLLILQVALRSWLSTFRGKPEGVDGGTDSGSKDFSPEGVTMATRLLNRCLQHCSVCAGRHLKKAVVKPIGAANGKPMKNPSPTESLLQLERVLALALLTSSPSLSSRGSNRQMIVSGNPLPPLHHRCLSFLFAGLRERYGAPIFPRQEIPKDCLLLDADTGQPLDLVSGLWAPSKSNEVSLLDEGSNREKCPPASPMEWVQESWKVYFEGAGGANGEQGIPRQSDALRDLLENYAKRLREYGTAEEGEEPVHDFHVGGSKGSTSSPTTTGAYLYRLEGCLLNRFARSPDWTHEWQCAMTIQKKSNKGKPPSPS